MHDWLRALFSVFVASLTLSEGFAQPPATPAMVPKLELKALDGTALDLQASTGVTTELLFVARWCGPCERETALARRRQAEFQRQNYRVVIVGVAQRQTAAQLGEWAQATGWQGLVVFDEGSALEKALGAKLLPWHTVVAPGGAILYNGDASPDSAAVRGWLGR
jgi:peroxiredoxin